MRSLAMDTQFMSFCYDVFDKLPLAVNILDQDGKIIFINKTFCNFLGVTVGDSLGRLVTEVNSNSKFLDVLKSKQAEIACKHKFHNGKDAIVHRIPIFDDDGNVIGGFGMVLFDDVDKMQEVLDKFKAVDKELRLYKNEMARLNSAKYDLNDIIGESEQIINCKKKVKKMAKVNSNVLILGESGVGKELFAHSIHNQGPRKNNAFVSINCSAIPENLIESELFGYEEGSFTGAKRGGNIGKFQLAEGGTIFLDEIAEMPLHMQVKLLRVLQEKEVMPIGGKSPIPINVRVVCATCRNLEEMVAEGKFREDLYYRLNVLTLDIPPLRERAKDIPLLAERFLTSFYKETGMYRHIPKNIMEILIQYPWHGNVRELRNILEKICVNADDINITLSDLPPHIVNETLKKKYISTTEGGLNDILNKIEKEIIIEMLKECNYNKSEASKKLNIPRASLYRKIEEYGIELKM
ncbi:sigma-54 interaction domain-containing protein [Clostridium amylolyticum]|nr:sigma 54-interacting transcriptional regulator [Clostridium amylolyticum]